MYASDRRVPAIVAENAIGRFEERTARSIMGNWLDAMMEDMKAVRESENGELSFTEEEIAQNQRFWDAVSNPEKLICSENTGTRANLPPLGNGHYELYSVYSYNGVYDSIPHLTKTHWHQGYPYNIYCPFKSNLLGRTPAGCVAISGAQMLYFLHDKLGVPDSTVSQASCTGDITTMTQWDYSSTIWDLMPHDGADANSYLQNGAYAAPLIAQIGVRVNMLYGDNASNAFTKDLVNNVFLPYGITCQYVAYDETLLFNSLLSGMPVIMRAETVDKKGHSFIVDGYKRTCTVTEYIYRWIHDEDWDPIIGGGTVSPNAMIPYVPDMTTYTYSNIQNSYIRMNWGWFYTDVDGPWGPEGDFAENTWFAPTGNWVIKAKNENFEDVTMNFNVKRYMIYNFKVKD